MNNYLYNILNNYFHVLENTGYVASSEGEKLLIASFYKDFQTKNSGDQRAVEAALNCLYHSSCFLQYPRCMRE